MKKILAVLFCVVFLCSCSSSGGDGSGNAQNVNTEFGVAFVPEANVNPLASKNKENLELFGLVYEGMFELDEKFEAIPALCESYTKQDTLYRFTIKSGIKFSDGSPLTADDVVYSVTLAMGENSYFAPRLSNVASVSANGNEVLISLYNPNAKLSNLLDIPVIKKGSELSGIAIGTGPYVLSYNAEQKEYKLSKNPHWRGKEPLVYDNIQVVSVSGIDQLVWGFESMNIDLITQDPTGASPYQFRGDYQSTDISTTSLVHLGFNYNVRVFQNANVRRAISCAIDRESAIAQDFALMGHATTLPIHPLCRAFNKEIASSIDYSKERAMTYFEEGGLRDSNNDGKLDNSYRSYTLLVNSENKSRVALARRISETLTNLGFVVNVREEKWDAYRRSLANGDFDMYITEVNMRGDFNLDSIIRSGSSLNYGGYSSSETDAKLLAYNTLKLSDSDEMNDFLKHLTESCPIVPILFKKHSAMTHKDFFSYLCPTSHNAYHKFSSWKVVE